MDRSLPGIGAKRLFYIRLPPPVRMQRPFPLMLATWEALLPTDLRTVLLVAYTLLVVVLCLFIIVDGRTPSKVLAYVLLVVALPVVGAIFYLSVGINYRKRKIYRKKLDIDERTYPELEQRAIGYTQQVLAEQRIELAHFAPLAQQLTGVCLLSQGNRTHLLRNGDTKFPEVLAALEAAQHHIHLEYYIFNDDGIGRRIAEVLMRKARAGVKVRFIYDDYGSSSIRRSLVRELRAAGVEAFPFRKILLLFLANGMNYRNHRKIIVVDGRVGFVGRINVSDKYINADGPGLYWRDEHLRIDGPAVLNLQHIFLTDWNFCSGQRIAFSEAHFPLSEETAPGEVVQVVSSGPDSDHPDILYALVQAVMLSRTHIRFTTPYFIPDKSLLDALCIAARSGVTVDLLVPGISDSWIVNTTSRSYYSELLAVGVRIHAYRKGFVHAKTAVFDDRVAMVGTANLDHRSFDLNFEVNAFVYHAARTTQLAAEFDRDLLDADRIDPGQWARRPVLQRGAERILHLFSALM